MVTSSDSSAACPPAGPDAAGGHTAGPAGAVGDQAAPADLTRPRDPGAGTFDALFCELLDKLYRRATMFVGSRQLAEDAVHEVYLKLAARPAAFLRHPEPYAYAFATLVSVVRDTWRRERRQVLVPDVEPDVEPAQGTAHVWDGGVDTLAAELEAVRLLGQLSIRQASVVILVDLDGYTIDQAADILRLHRGTVARTRTRALRKLRGALTGEPATGHGAAHGGKTTAALSVSRPRPGQEPYDR